MTTLTSTSRPEYLVGVIRSEFEEMPGMHLTRQQFGRLWNLDWSERERIIDELVAEGFLGEDPKGRLYWSYGDRV